MTDRPHGTPGDDAEREIAALRAELRAGGLLPGLPAAHEPTEASAEAMLRRVLASNVPLVDTPVDEPVDELSARRAADARRRRTTVTRTLFGLAATVLVGAAIVVPMMSQGGADTTAESTADTATETAFEGIQPAGDGLDSGVLTPRGFDDAPPSGLAPLVGVVIDRGGCLAVRQEETGTVYIPVDAAGATVREQLRAGERVAVQPAAETDVLGETDVPPGCDPAGPFWPASSVTVLAP